MSSFILRLGRDRLYFRDPRQDKASSLHGILMHGGFCGLMISWLLSRRRILLYSGRQRQTYPYSNIHAALNSLYLSSRFYNIPPMQKTSHTRPTPMKDRGYPAIYMETERKGSFVMAHVVFYFMLLAYFTTALTYHKRSIRLIGL